MEALAAVSLAGNILQFLDFTSNAISKSRQIHASTSGSLKEHDDLQDLTLDLKGLSGRLQASAGPVDPVLEHLCIQCREVADEMLKALESLRVKGKCIRIQSLRKTLKVLWGKEKLKVLEKRLAGFRQEFTLHVTVELRSRIDVLDFEQSQSFQALDDATKESAQKILDVLQDNRDHLVATTDEQTRQLRALHAQTERMLDHEFETAAVNLVEQSKTTLTLTTKEQERSRFEVLNAIADAASGYDDALSTESGKISARIEEANENNRAQIIKLQEAMKQDIDGLQRGLHQLQLKIDRKAEELKEIVFKISATREGPDRKLLKEKGNSAMVVLMSLHELYKALQKLLKPLIHQARIAFGNVFRPQDDRSAIEQPTFELETNSLQVGSSLPMYYAFYYQPLFLNFCHQRPASEVFSSTKMDSWIRGMHLTPGYPGASSPEAHAFFDLARKGNELVWTMTTLVAGLNACLTPEEAVLVLSTALSLRYDPRCVLPRKGTCLLDTDIPSRVALLFSKGSAIALQRPRYGLDCTLGRRLREDYVLMSHLANNCGLQEEISRKVNVGCSFNIYKGQQRADLTLALVALTSQSSSWQARQVARETFMDPSPRILFDNAILYVDPSASQVVDFLHAIQSAGLSIDIEGEEVYVVPSSPIQRRGPNFESRYRSKKYSDKLKDCSWWPPTDVVFFEEISGKHLKELQNLEAARFSSIYASRASSGRK